MSTTATTKTTIVPGALPASLSLPVTGSDDTQYRYAHLLPVFPKDEHYPPLTPFEHVDPGQRALKHPNPRSFLANATVAQLTPPIGEEVRGVNLATLDNDSKDQLALEVRNCSNIYREHIIDQVTGREAKGLSTARPTGLH